MTIIIDRGSIPDSLRSDDLVIAMQFDDARAYFPKVNLASSVPFSAQVCFYRLRSFAGRLQNLDEGCEYTIHTFGCPREILDTTTDGMPPIPSVSTETGNRMLRPVSKRLSIELSLKVMLDWENSYLGPSQANAVRPAGCVGEVSVNRGRCNLDLTALRTLSFHQLIEAHEWPTEIVFLRTP